MTIREIIENIGTNNSVSDKKKIRWLSELDLQIYQDIVLRHEGAELYMHNNGDGTYSDRELPYTADTCQLIAPERFARMYEAYLKAQIDYESDEPERYSNDITLFNNAYSEFTAWYNETHMPLQPASITTAPQYRRSNHHADPFSRV